MLLGKILRNCNSVMNNSITNQLSPEIKNTYLEFEQCLAIINCKAKHFFERYHLDVIDNRDDEIETKRFYEKHKKKLQRRSHTLEELREFIDYIIKLEDFTIKGWIKPVCLSEGEFSDEFELAMADISQLVTQIINNKKETSDKR